MSARWRAAASHRSISSSIFLTLSRSASCSRTVPFSSLSSRPGGICPFLRISGTKFRSYSCWISWAVTSTNERNRKSTNLSIRILWRSNSSSFCGVKPTEPIRSRNSASDLKLRINSTRFLSISSWVISAVGMRAASCAINRSSIITSSLRESRSRPTGPTGLGACGSIAMLQSKSVRIIGSLLTSVSIWSTICCARAVDAIKVSAHTRDRPRIRRIGRMNADLIRDHPPNPSNPWSITNRQAISESLSDREVLVRTRHSRRLVQHDESPIEPDRADRRLYSQPKSDRLGHVARFHVTNSLEDVAGVREQAASEDSIQRESQLVVDREQAVAPQRACLKYRIAARVFDYVSIRIALGDYDLRSRFLKSEAAQIASASPKEPLRNWKRLLSAKRRCQAEPGASRKHGVAKSVNRIEAIVLYKQLHELLAAAK